MKRRVLLQAVALQAITGSLGGCRSRMDAGRPGSMVSHFTPEQAACLKAAGEILAPGAAHAGLITFIESQLACPPGDSFLFIKYLDQLPPWSEFYRAAATGLVRASRERFGQPFEALSERDGTQMIQWLRDDRVPDWTGPSPSLVYTVLRADAIDVVYGTQAGFDLLDVPYLAHITPASSW